MKLHFQITHPNGDVTFCKVTPRGDGGTVGDMTTTVRECHPNAAVSFIGWTD